ncbi:MAG: STAS domain-containing protein [Mycobacterium sp.]|uniref:STAS domain-containing protein n=1 Tax=Mycobacterium sp. TaxID=1785 RepID=UPI003F949239
MADFAGAQIFAYACNFGTVLRIDGEIDAANAQDVAQAIGRFARLKTPLILDLSHLDFLSVEGFRALLGLNHQHKKARVHCSVVSGAAMRPLMRIVNDHGLTVAGSVPEALQLIEDIVRARRQLLSDLLRQRRLQRRVTAVPS